MPREREGIHTPHHRREKKFRMELDEREVVGGGESGKVRTADRNQPAQGRRFRSLGHNKA